MLHKGNYVKRLLRKLDVKQDELTDKESPRYIGIGRNTLITLLKNEEFKDKTDIDRVKTILTEINASQEAFDFVFPKESRQNARDLGEYNPNEEYTPMKEISPGFYLLTAELVPIHAQAGYLSNYQDIEYLESLPKYTITVDKFVRGKYRYFEASGESMNNGNVDEAIPNGTILLCREINRNAWTSKLHTHQWPNFVFVHRTEGTVVKQIAHQSLELGTLVLRSLNTDKEKYPDFTVNMDDLLQIYNVVKRIMK